ncbi:Hint domain-containing protein [Ruegeria arenilitoris]|uniref:Hint domain-containing protein n=1 Tax=Ruegeria arenilitoris TaxID=1173585 RepID=UPI00147EC0C5|nr:Hint domain-containing protein [Ruegeria arenilitoris]
MVSIIGDTTGSVTGDPPNVADGDLGITSGFPIISQDWEIQTPPAFGTATIDPATGEWTYTVDPTFFDDLDNGEIVTDTFTVQVTAVVSVFGFPVEDIQTQQITITIEGVCFTAGTLINARDGPCLIENLRVGDLVVTEDHGLQPIRWIEGRQMSAEHLRANPAMRPVRIAAGSLGPGLPKRDLLVSQQHRVLVRGPKVELLFGASEALVAAKHLCSWPGISVDTSDKPVEYMHILLDRHEILMAESAPAESLFLGEEALHTLSSDGLQELAEIFPDRPASDGMSFGRAARVILREHEARALA